MKKVLKTILVLIILFITLGYLGNNLGILEFSDLLPISEEKMKSYTGFYYEQLDDNEKQIYIKLDEAIREKEQIVPLGRQEENNLSNMLEKVMISYMGDNPECFYLSNEYTVVVRDILVAKLATLNIQYIQDINIEEAKVKLNETAEKFINEVISEGMTDFEKELAIHNKLVEQVDYYEYENIEDIPDLKHSAYGALVDKSAVCDGYSKAFKILLDKIGIESIIIRGETNDVAHAWNLVKLEDDYYHVDVTSDVFNNKNKKYTIHIYFNITDKQISKTHNISGDFNWPEANSNKYEYYNANGMILNDEDSIYSKMSKIVKKAKKSNILEFKIDAKYNKQMVLDTLYDMDFNNWKTNRLTSVTYSKIDDVYIFIK